MELAVRFLIGKVETRYYSLFVISNLNLFKFKNIGMVAFWLWKFRNKSFRINIDRKKIKEISPLTTLLEILKIIFQNDDAIIK